jgi:hypothetical protein
MLRFRFAIWPALYQGRVHALSGADVYFGMPGDNAADTAHSFACQSLSCRIQDGINAMLYFSLDKKLLILN